MDNEVMELSGVQQVWAYVKEMQESRRAYLAEQREERARQRAEENLVKRQRQQWRAAFLKSQEKPVPWRFGERCSPEALSATTYLPNRDIHARELHKVTHLLPRSYLYPVTPVKMTKNSGDFFGQPPSSLLTPSGRKFVKRNRTSLEAHAEKKRLAALQLKTLQLSPKWLRTTKHSSAFDKVASDYYNYWKPASPTHCETKPFLRTTPVAQEFSYP